MGSVKKILSLTELPDRELHHSRMFIDLAENIHIHFREFRFVFSLDEFFEFVDIIQNSTRDVRTYLSQNTDYLEGAYPTTIMIAGGKQRQKLFLKNSPKPNQSFYFPNDFVIELQDEFVTDEIHIHFRDLRIALNRPQFKIVARDFNNALQSLEEFEKNNHYERVSHPDRDISDFNASYDKKSFDFLGIQEVHLDDIISFHYKDILEEFKYDKSYIKYLIKKINSDDYPPIILSKKINNKYTIIDGTNRVYAALKLKKIKIKALITDLSYDEAYEIRKVDSFLRDFDSKTHFKYKLNDFYKFYLSEKMNTYYANDFSKKIFKMNFLYKFLRNIKELFFGKKNIFIKFNEKYSRDK